MFDLHVISLVRSQARRERFARLNAHLPFVFVDAVDGRELRDPERHDPAMIEPGMPYLAGAFGGALSHLARWEHCIASGRPLTVVEDDAIFRHDFAAAHARALAELDGEWDLVLWGWNLDYYVSLRCMPEVSTALMRFDPTRLPGAVDAFQAGTEAPRLLRLDRLWGVPGYTVSPAGAAGLKRLCFPLASTLIDLPIAGVQVPNVGIDSAMNHAYRELRAFVAFPPIVLSENDRATSTIQPPPVRKGLLSRTWKRLKPARAAG